MSAGPATCPPYDLASTTIHHKIRMGGLVILSVIGGSIASLFILLPLNWIWRCGIPGAPMEGGAPPKNGIRRVADYISLRKTHKPAYIVHEVKCRLYWIIDNLEAEAK